MVTPTRIGREISGRLEGDASLEGLPGVVRVITPDHANAGQSFEFKLTRAEAGEAITFRVRSSKATFTGPAA